MERNPEQQLISQFALWVDEVYLTRVYWILLLCEYGIYNKDQPEIQNVMEKSASSILPDLFETKTYLETVLDLFLWIYEEDTDLCFEMMKYVYHDFNDRDDFPDPNDSLQKLESFEEGESFDGITEPEPQLSRTMVVEEGAEFNFYRKLSSCVDDAEREVLIIDPYVNQEVIELYLTDLDESVSKKILTKNTKDKFDQVAEKFTSRSSHSLEIRKHNDLHDRIVFVDGQCFIVGISLKDAGYRRPTYIIQTKSTKHFRKPWEDMWENASEYEI